MTNVEIYEKIKEQLPRYTDAKLYKQKYDQFIDLTMSCDREEAIGQCRYFLEAAIDHWDLFGILAAQDLYTYLKNGV
mgnify:CR=1 FL=1